MITDPHAPSSTSGLDVEFYQFKTTETILRPWLVRGELLRPHRNGLQSYNIKIIQRTPPVSHKLCYSR